MPTLSDIRQQYPQYQDVPDGALADALYKKFYSDIPRSDFDGKLGIKPVLSDQDIAIAKAPDIGQATAIGRGMANGLTLSGYDELRGLSEAGGVKPDEPMSLGSLLRGGFNRLTGDGDGYQQGKNRAATNLKVAESQYPISTMAGDIGGSIGSAIGLGGVSLGARAAQAGQGVGRTILGSILDGTVLGGAQGALGADEGKRLEGAGYGAVTGGVVGGVAQAGISGIKAAASPIIANIRARANPEAYAGRQVARAVSESKLSADDISRRIMDADASGQGVFSLADALGNPGQRMLSTVARSPGEGRTTVVNMLNARQAEQGQRLGQMTDDALGASGTARQTTDDLTKQARTDSAPFYAQAMDRKPVWNDRLQEFFDDPVTKAGLKNGVAVQRLESLAEGKRFNPTDYAITHFDEAGDPVISGVPNMRTINLIKKGWDNQLESYRDKTTGRLVLDEYGRALDGVRRSFLNEVDGVNPTYAKARSLYAGPAQIRDAIMFGSNAVNRGRSQDNIGQFFKLSNPSQQGYRTGYADKLSENFERATEGVNKARSLTSDKRSNELAALSLYQGPTQPSALGQLEQRIGRENTMFETRNTAMGGSKTADNLADQASMAVDPTFLAHVISGNVAGAVRHSLQAGTNVFTGNTAAVRQHIAELLIQNGQTFSQAELSRIVERTMSDAKRVQDIARGLARGSAAAIGSQTNRR